MIEYLISPVSFLIAVMLQYGIFSRWTLLSGCVDIVLLFIIAFCLHSNAKRLWLIILFFGAIIGTISALPFYIPLAFYFGVYLLTQQFRKRIMQTPLLSMYLSTFISTLTWHGINIAWLFVKRIPFDFSTAFFEILLPSVLLNMLFSFPVHAITQEISRVITPKGAEA